MLTRDNTPFDVIWVHMNTAHVNYAGAIAAMRVIHENAGSFKLSINLKDDGTESLVKVFGQLPAWITGKPWQGAVTRVFTPADHDEAFTLVTDPLWEPVA